MKIYSNIDFQSFKASINKNTSAMKTVCAYMDNNKDIELPYKNTKKELELFHIIEKALAKHPSKEVLNITRILDNRFFWNERALIKTTKASLVDVEPVRDDSIAGELGIIRRILDPENKDMFNKLMGEEFSNKYDKWWNKYITPIWGDINQLYRENPKIEPNINDSEYNECFRKQIDIYESQYLSKTNKYHGNNINKTNNSTTEVKGFDNSGLRVFVLGFAIMLGSIYALKKHINKQNFQHIEKTATMHIKDSLNKISNDTLDLTNKILK